MTVSCKVTKNADISPLVLPYDNTKPISENNFINTIEESTGGMRLGYALTLEQTYIVYAVLIYQNNIRFLLQNDDGIPMFYSSELFAIVDKSVCFDWEINTIPVSGSFLTVLGYHSITSYSSIRDMIEFSPHAISDFLEYKATL